MNAILNETVADSLEARVSREQAMADGITLINQLGSGWRPILINKGGKWQACAKFGNTVVGPFHDGWSACWQCGEIRVEAVYFPSARRALDALHTRLINTAQIIQYDAGLLTSRGEENAH